MSPWIRVRCFAGTISDVEAVIAGPWKPAPMRSTSALWDSAAKRLGVKVFGGQAIKAGGIIIRQRGTKWHPGTNVGIGKDHTIFATSEGQVEFRARANGRTYVSVVPATEGAPE